MTADADWHVQVHRFTDGRGSHEMGLLIDRKLKSGKMDRIPLTTDEALRLASQLLAAVVAVGCI
jgi:hypothetical protein